MLTTQFLLHCLVCTQWFIHPESLKLAFKQNLRHLTETKIDTDFIKQLNGILYDGSPQAEQTQKLQQLWAKWSLAPLTYKKLGEKDARTNFVQMFNEAVKNGDYGKGWKAESNLVAEAGHKITQNIPKSILGQIVMPDAPNMRDVQYHYDAGRWVKRGSMKWIKGFTNV